MLDFGRREGFATSHILALSNSRMIATPGKDCENWRRCVGVTENCFSPINGNRIAALSGASPPVSCKVGCSSLSRPQ